VQTDEFTDKQSKLLNDLYGTVTRLTRLNKSMLLLAKIENGLITDDNQEVDIKKMIKECLYQHEEMIHQLNINLQTDFHDKRVKASKLLMEVLLNNLISNAIRHNHSNGEIKIVLDTKQLNISNTGTGTFNFEQVLKRFHKSDGSEGIGLGLTLCKQICDNYGFKLNYSLHKNTHTFAVSFE
jgi:signal transduction histidine kinase